MTPQEEQVKWLQDASNSVKRNAFYMKRALVRASASIALDAGCETQRGCIVRRCTYDWT